MLFTEPMKKIELLVLRSDADSVMRSLGFAGCVQLITEAREARGLDGGGTKGRRAEGPAPITGSVSSG